MGSRALVCSGLGSGLERVMLQQQTHKAVLEKPLARPSLLFASAVLAGLGWAAAGLGWAGLSSRTF